MNNILDEIADLLDQAYTDMLLQIANQEQRDSRLSEIDSELLTYEQLTQGE